MNEKQKVDWYSGFSCQHKHQGEIVGFVGNVFGEAYAIVRVIESTKLRLGGFVRVRIDDLFSDVN